MRLICALVCFAVMLSSQPVRATATMAMDELNQQVIKWRRHLHQYPELSNREYKTAQYIASHLQKMGLDVQTGIAHTGVVAKLKGDKPGPFIALRADMDALPVTEQVDLPFASKQITEYKGKQVGVMHACGHDTHVAILMGVAKLLSEQRSELAGEVMFIFQPAEEGAPDGEQGGAELMLKEGLFKNKKPEAIFGLHATSRLKVGQVGYRSGPMMASEDSFSIKVKGKQTHGSRPWRGVDPIVTAAQIVMSAQTIASRQVDVTQAPSVLSFGAINGGIRSNIIPDEVELIGTIRTFDQAMRADIKKRLIQTADLVAQSAGAQAQTTINDGYPVTINNPALTRHALQTLTGILASENVKELSLITGAEDFSYYALETPGFFFMLGVTPTDQDLSTAASNHSPKFFVDEQALSIGVKTLSQVALQYLNKAQPND